MNLVYHFTCTKNDDSLLDAHFIGLQFFSRKFLFVCSENCSQAVRTGASVGGTWHLGFFVKY